MFSLAQDVVPVALYCCGPQRSTFIVSQASLSGLQTFAILHDLWLGSCTRGGRPNPNFDNQREGTLFFVSVYFLLTLSNQSSSPDFSTSRQICVSWPNGGRRSEQDIWTDSRMRYQLLGFFRNGVLATHTSSRRQQTGLNLISCQVALDTQ